jgi:AcrR family transcriptional regulator
MRRVSAGERTRNSILEAAVDLASLQGLEGLTIGILADELQMSKSGLFAHFGSKEELQLATVEAASERFIREVWTPAMKSERGLARLRALCDAWLSYAQRQVFPGGCFFASASAEFDGRPGLVRDRIATLMEDWLDALAGAVERAQATGEVDPHADPSQIAFELHSLMSGANWAFQLYRDPKAFRRARAAIEHRTAQIELVPATAKRVRRQRTPAAHTRARRT